MWNSNASQLAARFAADTRENERVVFDVEYANGASVAAGPISLISSRDVARDRARSDFKITPASKGISLSWIYNLFHKEYV
jgi:hypothetical protein